MRGSWRPNRTAIYWPPLLWPSVLCFSYSPGLLNRRPRGPALCWMVAFSTTSCLQLLCSPTQSGSQGPLLLCGGFLYHILSLTHLIPNSIGGPEGPFCWVVAFPTTSCLQLLCLQLNRGSRGPFCRVVAFPTTSFLQLVWSPTLDRGSWGGPLLLGGSFPYHILFPTNWLAVFHRVI